ncbi:putative type II thioesterase [Streptomyces sp. NBRC 110611]|uniref:thioesterase II family protein n=1 Tax=Streptomyces sp. NBRC 110611 TaxID=1621259 RepID=UPI0008332239|nr:alpha/beta fold hydrolase [Streptomyces sp. NBRC 110611]GAU68940.1 putative type II thioesterase [Streptomyces sp. NBRC 110611]
MDSKWLTGPDAGRDAGTRLFCLPYAGGGAAAYRDWPGALPGGTQVCPVELPGRGRRLKEPPYSRLRPLVAALADALRPALDRPYALFGHSMGGLLAFELTRTLRERGLPQPVHLFVSGAAAPGTRRTRPVVHNATDAEMRGELRVLNGTPRELLENAELMELMLPTLRADFSVLETYTYQEAPPLAVPLTVLAGTADPSVEISALQGWRDQTTAGSRLKLFAGDHFFLHSATAEVIATVREALAPGLSTAP